MGRSIGKEVWFLLMPTLLSITFAMQWTPFPSSGGEPHIPDIRADV